MLPGAQWKAALGLRLFVLCHVECCVFILFYYYVLFIKTHRYFNSNVHYKHSRSLYRLMAACAFLFPLQSDAFTYAAEWMTACCGHNRNNSYFKLFPSHRYKKSSFINFTKRIREQLGFGVPEEVMSSTHTH